MATPHRRALEQLVDPRVRSPRSRNTFRSDDPGGRRRELRRVRRGLRLLWASTVENSTGSRCSPKTAAPQLIRWEFALRLDSLRRGLGRGEGDLARRRPCPHAARCGHVGRLRRAVSAGAGQACPSGTRRHDEYRVPPRPRKNGRVRWRNGMASLLENLVDTDGVLLDRIAGHARWVVQSRLPFARGSRTGAEHRRRSRPGDVKSAKAARPQRLPRVCCGDRATAPREHGLLGYRRPERGAQPVGVPCRRCGFTSGERVEELDQVCAVGWGRRQPAARCGP